MGELGERLGYSAAEARMLSRVGAAVVLFPPLRTLLLKGRVTLEGAASLWRVLRDPRVLGQDSPSLWVYWAKVESGREFRLRVQRRLEEVRAGGEVHEITVHLSDRGVEAFDRARDLLSAEVRRNVSESEAVERLSDYYLDREDPRRAAPRPRRVGDTSLTPSRYIPQEVRREVLLRSRGKCEVPFCSHTRELEFAHGVAHSRGGAREASDLVHLCHTHHVAHDSGWLRVVFIGSKPTFHPGPATERQGPWKGPDPDVLDKAPHFRPNPHAAAVGRWTCTRPPPQVPR